MHNVAISHQLHYDVTIYDDDDDARYVRDTVEIRPQYHTISTIPTTSM